jgi:photosystem II stability/assembly factor-like uncharacterized protein
MGRNHIHGASPKATAHSNEESAGVHGAHGKRGYAQFALNMFLSLVVLTVLGVSAAAAQSVPLADVAHIHGVAFDAKHPGQLLLATHYGLYRTERGGLAQIVSEDANDYMGFTPSPDDPDLLLASGHPATGGNMGFIVSTDGGVTWSQRSPGASGPVDFHALTVSRADSRVIYGLYGSIQVSRDGGTSWEVTGPAPERTIDLAASALEVDTLYAGTAAGLAVSKDAGATWQMWGDPVPLTMVETAPSGKIYAFYAGVGLIVGEKDGTGWKLLSGDLGAHDFLHFAVDPADERHLVAVTQDSLILESRDGGSQWEQFVGP